MNEQSAHIVAPAYCMQSQSEAEKDERYLEKITHWDTRSFSPNFPPSVHIDYPTKEERKEISESNERQWTIDWRCNIPNAVNVDIRNERQLQLPHSYVQNNNRESFVVTSYPSYSEIDNSNDVSVATLSSNNLNSISSNSLDQVYPIDSKLQIKNKKFIKPKYFVGENDWNYQALDTNEQMYEQYENEIEKNSAINLSFTNEAQIYNKQKASNEQQRNSIEVITDDQFNSWNVPHNKSLIGENISVMPILEKIDKKSALDPIHVEKISTFTELHTYTPPTEREMPVLEHMIESYGSQNKFKQFSTRGNFNELSVETPIYDDNFDKKAIYQDFSNNLVTQNSNAAYLSNPEKRINPRTQAIRNMKRMRTSLYSKNQIYQDKYDDDVNTEDILSEENLAKMYHSHKKYKFKDKKVLSVENNLSNTPYLIKFQDFYISSDININYLKKIGQEELLVEKLPESVFNEYKIYDYSKTESTVILPSDKDFPLKMTFRINRECNVDALKTENFNYKNNQKFPPFQVSSNSIEKLSKRTVKSKTLRIDNSNEFNDDLSVQVSKFSTTDMSNNIPPIRLPLKLKIKLPNKDFLNYRQSIVESKSSDKSQSYEIKLRERKCLRERTSSRIKPSARQTSKMRTKRSSVDYGPDAYYHLLNIDELWDVLDDDVVATAKQDTLTYPDSKRIAQDLNDIHQSFKDNSQSTSIEKQNFQDTIDLSATAAEVMNSRIQISPCDLQTSKEVINTEIKTESADIPATRKSILLSVKGEEVYDFMLQENFTSKQCEKENDLNHSDILVQSVCDNNIEENQKLNTEDDGISIETKSIHSEFLDYDKLSPNPISYEGIAQSNVQVFPISKSCANNYRQSVIFQHETQVQPLVLQKDYKNSEMDFNNESKDQFISHDENKNQSVNESNNSSKNIDHLEISVCQKIPLLNQEEI